MAELKEDLEGSKAGQQQAMEQAKTAAQDRDLLQRQIEALGTGGSSVGFRSYTFNPKPYFASRLYNSAG